jgi:hypothetical protein
MGIDNAASPESVAEKDTGITPGTISFAVIGSATGTARCDLQIRIAFAGGRGFPLLHVHAGKMAQPTRTIAQRQARSNRRIHNAVETFSWINNAKNQLKRVNDIMNGRPITAMCRPDNPTHGQNAPHEISGQGRINDGQTGNVLCAQSQSADRPMHRQGQSASA